MNNLATLLLLIIIASQAWRSLMPPTTDESKLFAGCLLLIVLMFYYVRQRHSKFRQQISKTIPCDAAKIGHDIKSPLSTLRAIILRQKNLNPKEHEICRYALSKIDSLSSLLSQNRIDDEGDYKILYTLIDHSLENLVHEKNLRLKSKNIRITLNKSNDYQLGGIGLSESFFVRLISNLIDNAIDSFFNLKRKGHIGIELSCLDDSSNLKQLLIKIKDNGCGMDAQTLAKVRQGQGSFHKANGHGLGVKSAIESINEAAGSFSINSLPKIGTEVEIKLPYLVDEKWIVTNSCLDLSSYKKVILLEDDQSIAEVWKTKLEKLELEHYKSTEEFLRLTKSPDTFYILDNQIDNSRLQGIDLIEEKKLNEDSILATSYFNNDRIQERVINSAARLLPKYLISELNINFKKQSSQAELVLIDDDDLVHKFWQYEARLQKLKIDCYYSAEAFIKNSKQYSLNIRLYIDYHLGTGTNGVIEAKRLHSLGFNNISLATGESCKVPKPWPNFLRQVGDKSFPAKRSLAIKATSASQHSLTY